MLSVIAVSLCDCIKTKVLIKIPIGICRVIPPLSAILIGLSFFKFLFFYLTKLIRWCPLELPLA